MGAAAAEVEVASHVLRCVRLVLEMEEELVEQVVAEGSPEQEALEAVDHLVFLLLLPMACSL